MASEQLGKTVQVKPEEFSYEKGVWAKYVGPGHPAWLVEANQLEASAQILTNRLDIKASFVISFDISKPQDAYGWESADLSIKAQLGKNGKIYSHSINSQYLAMAVNERKTIKVHFKLNEIVEPSPDKLYFSLYDDTPGKKGGLKFFSATVDDGANVAE